MIPASAVGAVRKHFAQTGHRLALPGAHLVRMYLVLGRDLLDRLVAPQRFQRHPGLEFRRKPASIRHLVFLRYPVEYTLAPCPIFWDHLTVTVSPASPRTCNVLDVGERSSRSWTLRVTALLPVPVRSMLSTLRILCCGYPLDRVSVRHRPDPTYLRPGHHRCGRTRCRRC